MIIYLVRGAGSSWWNTGYGKGIQHGGVCSHLITFVDVDFARNLQIKRDKDHGSYPPLPPQRRKLT